jgi:hypothetical protein
VNTTQRVNAAGTKRRLEALFADGVTSAEIARLTGLHRDWPRRIAARSEVVNRRTAIAVYAAYIDLVAGTWRLVAWDDDNLDAPVEISGGTGTGVRKGTRWSVHLVEDLDDIAEQMGFVRWGTVTGWEPKARRHVAARLGMSAESFDRAVYRGRARLVERSAA